MNDLYSAAELFEVGVPEFKQLKACRREIGLLKSLRDVNSLVQSSFADWKTTLWKDINVENMEMDCRKFVKVNLLLSISAMLFQSIFVSRIFANWTKKSEPGMRSLGWTRLSRTW